MPLFGRSSRLSFPSILATFKKLRYSSPVTGVLLFLLLALSGPIQAQTPAPAAPATGRIIVKIKPSLAAETEAQFSGTAPGQPMQIRPGHSRSARLEAFLRRQSAQQISPLYPQIIRLKKQHGWSDAEFADHLRQRFAKRTGRVPHAKAVPEISRTYVLDFGSLTPQEQARTLQRLKADPDVEFAEPTHTFSSNQLPSMSPALVQTVNKPNTSVSLVLTAGTNPSLVGDTLTFTANLTPTSATGTVVFFDGSTPISGDVTLVGGSASFTTSSLPFGIHSITAQYSGDGAFNGSTSAAFLQTVNNPKANSVTSVNLSAGTNPSVFGNSLTFTANVTPASATGTVVFFDGPTPISGNLTLSSGTVSLTIPALSAGTHSITAQYSGDANVNPSTSAAWIQTVNKARTAVTLVQAEDADGLKLGAPGTFMATVTPTTATGSVVFFDGTTPISGAIALNNGTAVFTTSTLATGTHLISAQYGGDTNFNGSVSNSVKVKVK